MGGVMLFLATGAVLAFLVLLIGALKGHPVRALLSALAQCLFGLAAAVVGGGLSAAGSMEGAFGGIALLLACQGIMFALAVGKFSQLDREERRREYGSRRSRER